MDCLDLFYVLGVMFIAVFARLGPHLPDFTPQMVCLIYLGMRYSKFKAAIVILLATLISDFFLALQTSGEIFGSWTFFVYSGYIMCVLFFSERAKGKRLGNFLSQAAMATIVFWLWTNFGTWVSTGMYSHDMFGLLYCYYLAIPFLNNALLSMIAWSLLLFGVLNSRRFFSEILLLQDFLKKSMVFNF